MKKVLFSIITIVMSMLAFCTLTTYANTSEWSVPWEKGISIQGTTYSGHSSRGIAIDFPRQGDIKLYAPTNGTITAIVSYHPADYNTYPTPDYGNYVQIKSNDGYTIIMAHMKSINNAIVNKGVGATILKGEFLGYMGNTGCSTGQHLHFEVIPSVNSIFGYSTDYILSNYISGYDWNSEEYLDLGNSFCANIIERTAWATVINNNGNVEIGNGVGDINEYWWFERQSDGSYIIESLYDNKYLDVSGAGITDGTNIQTCVTTGSDAQKWYVKNGKYGLVLVPKHAKSSCLDCTTSHPTAGTNVKLWSQNGTEAQGLSIYKQQDWKFENIGDKFCANIIERTAWATVINNNGNVEIGNGVGDINEYWWFERQSDGSYIIESLYDNKYLDVSGAGTTDGTNIQTCVTTGSDAQKWYVKNGKYGLVLVPKHSKSSCLDCTTSYPTAGTNVKLWSQNGTEAQGLSVYKQEDWKFENIGDKFCANIIEQTAWMPIINNNGNVEIGNSVGDINEYWWFERQSDGSYIIESLYDNKYLDVSGAGTADGINIQTCVTTGSDAQKWYVKNEKYGFVLVPKHSKSSCLDCTTSYPTAGTNVKLWSQNGTEAQGLNIYKSDKTQTYSTIKYNNDELIVNSHFSNFKDDAVYIIALYKENKLIDINTFNINNQTDKLINEILCKDIPDNVKIMVWDNMRTMKPLCPIEVF